MANYKTIHTTYGLQRMAAAEAAGVAINLTHMAVGDGNGNEVTPAEGQTQLVREMYRATVNRIYQPDATQPTLYAAELIVPATAAGFTMREVALFDVDGGMFVVGNLPATYKPNVSEGAYADAVVRVLFMVTNAGIVTIMVDPNVTVATHQWITNNVTACFIMPGGTTHQVLRKKSNACGDIEWADPSTANVLVSTVEEEQTLAAAQTTVDLVLTNTTGLAIYIEGVRLPKNAGVDGWQPDGAIVTRLALGKSYPAGTKLIAVQNEPASNLPDVLEQPQNLADVPDKAAARTNLDVYSRAEVDARSKQPGDIFHTARTTAPARSLKANGAAVSRTAYATLFAVIGTAYGAGDGFNTFNLPDLRGEFIRSWDDSRGADPGRALGSWQASQNLAHSHGVNDPGHAHNSTSGDAGSGPYLGSGNGGSLGNRTGITANTTGITIQSSGGNEARPRNVAMLACIAY